MMWSEKHRPASLSAMMGNEEARGQLAAWLKGWRKGARPVLLVGPPGTGKTTAAFLACEAFGYDMVGLDASDARSRSRISGVLGPVMGNAGVSGRPALIFVDEVDGIHGRADFGGAEALLRLLKEPTVPVIMAANSDASPKMKSIEKASKTLRFRPVPPRLLRAHLRRVLREEGASLSPGTEIRTAEGCGGDMRRMLNAAQSLAAGFDIPADAGQGMLDAQAGTDAFFAAGDAESALAALRAMRMDPREKIGTLFSAVATARLPPEAAARAMDAISEADLLYGRILRTKQWRLLRYMDAALAAKLHRATRGAGVRYERYGLPWQLLNRIRWDGRAVRSLCGALGRRMHASSSEFSTVYLPYLAYMVGACGAEPPDLSSEGGDGGQALAAALAKEAGARGGMPR